MELNLSVCSITHIPKDGKKKKHELKIVHQGADALVLAVQSKEQAEEWLKVHQEISKLLLLPSHWIETLFVWTLFPIKMEFVPIMTSFDIFIDMYQ